MPDWYPLIVAAKYLGVAPWDLAKQSAAWKEMALIAREAEIAAQNHHAKNS